MTQEEKKYFDARNDLIKAYKSFKELTAVQKEQLAKEAIGTDIIDALYSFMQKYSIGR